MFGKDTPELAKPGEQSSGGKMVSGSKGGSPFGMPDGPTGLKKPSSPSMKNKPKGGSYSPDWTGG